MFRGGERELHAFQFHSATALTFTSALIPSLESISAAWKYSHNDTIVTYGLEIEKKKSHKRLENLNLAKPYSTK